MTDIARERRLLAEQGLDIATRETWGARQDYTSDRSVIEPAVGFALHISVTIDHGDLTGDEHFDLRHIEGIGQQRFGIGFPYNAAVFDTGRLYEGQPLTRRGAHTVDDKDIGYPSTGSSRSMNFLWRAIVLPQMVDDDVTDGQVDQCARWAAAQVRSGLARRDALWIGHRDVAWKSCPGDAGYARLPDIRRLTEHYIVNGLGPAITVPAITVPQEDDDMLTVIGVKGDAKRPFMALDKGSVIKFTDDPELVNTTNKEVWAPKSEYGIGVRTKCLRPVEYVETGDYDGAAVLAKRRAV